ncbi:MAG TPA: SRPBCC domain-containing protein [Candidatus Limnocylindria bacterium]|jgi:uncharacterized protein YndB with AHSA1/START domain|nr:SRPBCC domain-containing protein [Candidatus Limnocylindria bacterium]
MSERRLELYIRCTPVELWSAITDPDRTRLYWYGALNHSDWTPGARWTSESDDGALFLEGEIIELERPHRLLHTFHVVHEPAAAAEAPSRVEWQITPMGDACRLVLVHTELGRAAHAYTDGGWELILSGLKTLLETGQPLKVGQPAPM